MSAAPPAGLEPLPGEANWQFQRVTEPDPAWYEALYRRIGGNHLWYSRLALPADELAATIRHPDVAIHTLNVDGVPQGLVLWRRSRSCCTGGRRNTSP